MNNNSKYTNHKLVFGNLNLRNREECFCEGLPNIFLTGRNLFK